MDLELTDEQKLLGETVDQLLEKRYTPNFRLDLTRGEGWSRDLWKQYAELGLLGLPFDEQYGGAGMGFDELAVAMESFGRALVLEPYFATVVLGGALIANAGSPEQKAAILPGVAAGETVLAFAYAEAGSRYSLTDIATTATPAGDGWTVSGEKIAVLAGDTADQVVVSAKTPSGDIGLFLVAGADVQRDGYTMQDGQRGADLLFADAPAIALGEPADALEVIESVLDTATAALCAEAVGAMDRMLWMTVDYMKTRVQFGKPIAVFQALQHRAANMYVSLEQARSLALLAKLAVQSDDATQRRTMIRAAKIGVDNAARHVGQEAIQLHGGIGMTMEYPVGHYFKRVTVIAHTFGDSDTLVQEVGAAGGLVTAE
ncbi:MAG: acyl-CoA dehydrogenase family protein [Jatrophihabitans sp.]|uniref:acyl-CoA dehydrogenase family protein n=1 Tax=Jatrophihabitans sp. TaxID=1932789 RepID=UPI003F7F80FE